MTQESMEMLTKVLKYDNAIYTGSTVDDKKEGQGIIEYNNGDTYEGTFKNDKKQGKGIYYYKTGAKYDGDFHNDKKEGKGIYLYKNGTKYDDSGYDINGYDINGFNKNGFNRQGMHKRRGNLNDIESFITKDYPEYGRAYVVSVPYYIELKKHFHVNILFKDVKKNINNYDIEEAIKNKRVTQIITKSE